MHWKRRQKCKCKMSMAQMSARLFAGTAATAMGGSTSERSALLLVGAARRFCIFDASGQVGSARDGM